MNIKLTVFINDFYFPIEYSYHLGKEINSLNCYIKQGNIQSIIVTVNMNEKTLHSVITKIKENSIFTVIDKTIFNLFEKLKENKK